MPPEPPAPPNVRFPGLSAEEVTASRALHGDNLLTPARRDPWWVLWFAKFEDPVIRILVIAAGLQIAVGSYRGEYVEGLAIVAAILLATTLAFLNEYRAGREFDVLNSVRDDVPIPCVRGGQFVTVPKRDLVVGDIVVVEPGEEIPADCNLLESVALHLSEASLTGEALPVAKGGAGKPGAAEPAYPRNRLMRSTTVADGNGLARVTAEFGTLGQKATEETHETTPLNDQLGRLARGIGGVGLAVAAGTFFALVARAVARDDISLTGQQWVFAGLLFLGLMVALVRVWLKILLEGLDAFGFAAPEPKWLAEETLGRWVAAVAAGATLFAAGLGVAYLVGAVPAAPADWLPAHAGGVMLDAFMIAVVIIVVAVPEGLAMSVTLSLAYSMRQMTAQNTLVRRMHACETVGAATVICSDKTGTLTQNRMAVVATHFPALPGGQLGDATPGTPAGRVADAVAVNSTAQLGREGGVKAMGNPTEAALLAWLDGQGIDYAHRRAAFERTVQLPFRTDRKLMATAGPGGLHVKGAPEVVLGHCERVLTPDGEVPLTEELWEAIAADLRAAQSRALRTIGLADGPAPAGLTDDTELTPHLVGLTWLGFAGIADPVRPEVPDAVAACRRAGIRVKIVTGDTAETAREVGRQIGVDSDGPDAVLTGREFAALDDAAAADAADRLTILARARPLDKLRLVQLLQARREVVAVTGDGTNDAPALHHAKVGLAMGITGTAVAKEAADVVLLDDSFRSIVTAVKWGRGLYENIQRFLLFQLTINVAALGIALVGPFAGIDFPLTVLQMLWVNLIMDTFAALALATEPPTDRVLNRPPRKAADFIITPPMVRRIALTAGAFLAVMLTVLLLMPTGPGGVPRTPEQATWLTLFFSGFVLLQFWNLFNARAYGTGRSALAGLGRNPAFGLIAAATLVGQVVIVQFAGGVFRTVPLTVTQWAVLLAATSPVLLIGELARLAGRRSDRNPAGA
jgi:Ca2+-transporting ATPase